MIANNNAINGANAIAGTALDIVNELKEKIKILEGRIEDLENNSNKETT